MGDRESSRDFSGHVAQKKCNWRFEAFFQSSKAVWDRGLKTEPKPWPSNFPLPGDRVPLMEGTC